jgi:hypothetical protein
MREVPDYDRTYRGLQPHVVSLIPMKPDLAGEAANFVLAGAHAATSSAISAAKMSVPARVTKMRIFVADVQSAARSTGHANASLSEVALFVDQDIVKPTTTIAHVEGIAITSGKLGSTTETATTSAGGRH